MRRIQWWAINLTTTLISLGAIFASHIPQLQQIARAEGECHGRQILTAVTCAGDNLEPEEANLYQLVNQYRLQNGLPAIPISKSLTLVANRHVRDLDENIRTLTHGWSDCPYNPSDQSTWPCMWEAPQRFKTPYPGRGYENAHGGSGNYRASAVSALQGWQGSSLHNAVILNQGIWENYQWQALGVGIYKGYAVLWFGAEADPANITSNISRDLTGNWELETGTFGPECAASNDLNQFPVSFTQSGNQFTANGGTVFIGRGSSPANIGNGTLSGDRFQSKSDIYQWTGTVNSDGNLITGTVTCQMGGGGTGRGTLPFTMKRGSTSVQPNPVPVPPTESPYPLW